MSLSILQYQPSLLVILIFIVGLMVGSFLNVLIYRLPIMLKSTWQQQCLMYLELPLPSSIVTFNLAWPNSHCPHCQTAIKPWHNIPLLSYLWLKGQCAHCAKPISLRYPLLELLTGFCSAITAWHFGYGLQLLFALLLTWSLLALSFIDYDELLLPDEITQPMLWSGLLLSLFNIFADTEDSIIGAAAGYLSLWSVYQGFKWLTGKDGMAEGDFKLLAMLGAWLGWQYLLMIILFSSLTGALVGTSLIVSGKQDKNARIPFGPYLCVAGWLCLLWGDTLNSGYLYLAGL